MIEKLPVVQPYVNDFNQVDKTTDNNNSQIKIICWMLDDIIKPLV